MKFGTGTTLNASSGGILRSSASGGTFTVTGTAGTIVANGGGDLVFDDGAFTSTSNNLTISSAVGDDASVSGAKTRVIINGYVVMGSANTYTGGTFINQGRVQATNVTTLGVAGSAVRVMPGGEAFLNASGTWAQNFTIAGNGSSETNGGQNLGAIRMNQNNQTISGLITLAGDSRISGGSGNINIITGQITGTGQLEFTSSTGNGNAIELNNTSVNANNWTGGLQLTAASGRQVYLKLLANNQIPDGGSAGNVTLNGTGDIARLDLNGFSDTINGLTGATSANNQVANFGAAPSTLTIGNNNATASFGGNISDSGTANNLSIVKTGTGVQTLTGANTYVGNTTISQGTLALGSGGTLSGSPTITASSSAVFDVTGAGGFNLSNSQVVVNNGQVNGDLTAGSAGQVITGTGTFNGAVNINGGKLTAGTNSSVGTIASISNLNVSSGTFNIKVNGASADQIISIPGTASFAGNSVLNVQQLSAATSPTYTILTASSISGLSSGFLQTIGRATYSIDSTALSGNILQLDVTGGPAAMAWTGGDLANNPNRWDGNQSDANWIRTDAGGGDTTHFYQADNVTFDDAHNAPPGYYAISIVGSVAPSSIVVTTGSSNTYTFNDGGSGSITFGSLLMNSSDGTGALAINTNNSYAGGTTVQSGTVNANVAGALGTGNVTLSGGVLNLGANGAIGAGTLTFTSGTLDNTSGGTIILSNNSQVWNGGFTYSGSTGSLNMGTGAVNLSGSSTIGVAANTLTVSGPITDASNVNSLTKTGIGILALSGTSTFQGAVNINQGTVLLGGGSGVTPLGQGTSSQVTVASGGAIDLSGFTASTTAALVSKTTNIAGTGVGGTGVLLNTGSQQLHAFESVNLTADATIGGTNDQWPTTPNSGHGRYDFGRDTASTLSLNGDTLTKIGTNLVNFAANLTVGNGNIVVNNGVLSLDTGVKWQHPSDGLLVMDPNTILQFFTVPAGNMTTPIVFNGSGIAVGQSQNNNASTINSNINLNNTLTLADQNGATSTATTLTLTGVIADVDSTLSSTLNSNASILASTGGVSAGAGSITKSGSQTVVLSNANSYTGATTINAGTLSVGILAPGGSPSGIGASTAAASNLVFGGGTLQYTGTTASTDRQFTLTAAGGTIDASGSSGALTLSSTAAVTLSGSGTPTFTLTGTNAGNNTFAGTLGDSGGATTLQKTGSGKWILTGSQSFSGPTNVAGGTLAFSGGNNLLPTANTLSFTGSGTIDIGSTTQTVAALTVPDAAAITSFINGNGGSLIVTGTNDLQLGPLNPAGLATLITLDMSGLSNFTYNAASNTFRVGMKAGGNPTSNTAQNAIVTLGGTNTITANLFGVGDLNGARNPGLYTLNLGQTNILNANNFNVGYSQRSGAVLDFASGLTNPTVQIRAADGTSPASTFNIGLVANNATTTWTDTADFSNGTINALITSMNVGTADTSGQGSREGTTNATFTMGAGTVTVGTLNLGTIASTGGVSVGGTFAANAFLNLNSASGTLNVTTLAMATNTITDMSANSKSVTANLNINGGTLNAATIQKGAQTGTATASAAINWATGTIGNLSGSDLMVTGVPLNLSSANPHIFNISGGHTGTVAANATISGATSGLTKTGTGTLVLVGSNSYGAGTTVNVGTLGVANVHALGAGSLAIGAGATAQLQTGTGAGPVVLPSVSIAGNASPTATLDITNSKAVITNTSYASAVSAYTVARAQVTNALDGFAWDQPGITSSTVANDINNLGVPTSVAVILNNSSGTAGGGAGDASDELFYSDGSGSPTTNPNGLPQFAGTSVDQNSVLFKYTYIGDSNLDGMVDSTDFGLFLAGYNDPGTAASLGWAVGDYDYSGTVDSTDFGLFLAGYNYYASNPIPLNGAGGVQPVPEPGAFLLAVLAMAGLVVSHLYSSMINRHRSNCSANA